MSFGSSRQLIKTPPTFLGNRSQDPRRWFVTFDNIATGSGLSGQAKIEAIPPFLEGQALDFWLELPAGLVFTEIQKRFCDEFAPAGESDIVWSGLQQRYQSELETVDEFSHSVLKMVKKAMPYQPVASQKYMARVHFIHHSLHIYREALLSAGVGPPFEAAVAKAREKEAVKHIISCTASHAPQRVQQPPQPGLTEAVPEILRALSTLTDKMSHLNSAAAPAISAISRQEPSNQQLSSRMDGMEASLQRMEQALEQLIASTTNQAPCASHNVPPPHVIQHAAPPGLSQSPPHAHPPLPKEMCIAGTRV